MNRANTIILIICSAFLALVGCTKGPKSSLEKESYAYGHQLAVSANKSELKLNPTMVALAVDDVMRGRPARLSDQEIQSLLLSLSKKADQVRSEQTEQRRVAELKFVETYMALQNVQRSPQGVFYRVIRPGGSKDNRPRAVAKMHYVGSLSDGRVFDSTHLRGSPSEIKIDALPPGWQEAVRLMPVGAKWEVVIPPHLAYGPSGNDLIPPQSALKLEIELLETKGIKSSQ